jgi:SAM-dependent methyltransferase
LKPLRAWHDDARSLYERLDDSDLRDQMRSIVDFVGDMADSEDGPESKVTLPRLAARHIRQLMSQHQLTGPIAEVGGAKNSMVRFFPENEYRHLSIFSSDNPNMLVADVTNCPQIPDESFDVVVSLSCFEHMQRPWRAAEEITRILKPGGITYHTAPFSYFYHKAPVDYWRFTPDSFAFLFQDLEPLRTEFYSANRRRNNTGSASNPIDGHGEPDFAVDGFGGWRENWHAIYAGRKTPGYAEKKAATAVRQAVIDLFKTLRQEGTPEDSIAGQVSALLARVQFAPDGSLVRVHNGEGISLTNAQVRDVWDRRGELKIQPSFLRQTVLAVARAD